MSGNDQANKVFIDWVDVAPALSEEFACRVLTLFGSTGRHGKRAESDIDLLCISDRSGWRNHQLICSIGYLDVFCIHAGYLEEQLIQTPKRKMGLVLRALVEGEFLHGCATEFERFVQLAKKMWILGPPPLSQSDLEQLKDRCTKIRVTALRRLESRAKTVLFQPSSQLLSSRLFEMLVNDYCSVHSLWTSSISHLAESNITEYHELADFVRGFLNTTELTEQLSLVERFSLELVRQVNGG